MFMKELGRSRANPRASLDAAVALGFYSVEHLRRASEPEHWAASNRMKCMIAILSLLALCCSSARADICEAARYERVDKVQAYLAADTNAANSVGEKRFTPLHFAAEHSSSNGIQILKMLLAHGAKVDARNHIRQTPLFSAAIYDSAPAARVLLAHGAKVDARQDGGRTPLHWAALNGYCEVARVLIEHRADIKARTSEGKTALALATEELESWKKEGDAALIRRYQETVSLLRKSGASR
jgi:ankyrin repeat protein